MRVGGFFLIVALLFPLQLLKVEEGDVENSFIFKENFHQFFEISMASRQPFAYLSLGPFFLLADKRGQIRGSFYTKRRMVPHEKGVFAVGSRYLYRYSFRGNLLEIYKLKPPLPIKIGESVGVARLKGRWYVLFFHKGREGSCLFLYEQKGRVLRRIQKRELGLSIGRIGTCPYGFLIYAISPLTGKFGAGVSDRRAGVYLVGLSGRLLASWPVWGSYIYTRPVKLLKDKLIFSWTEVWAPTKHRSGLVVLDLERWKAIRERRFSKRSFYIPFYRGKRIPIFFEGGKLALYNDNLDLIAEAQLPVPILASTKLKVPTTVVWNFLYFAEWSSCYVAAYVVRIVYNDPMLFFPFQGKRVVCLLDKNFKVHKCMIGEEFNDYLVFGNSWFSRLKGGRYAIYEVIP